VFRVFLFLLLGLPLEAGLVVTFRTTRGDIRVSLAHDKAPRTVANFMTLATGGRAWIDTRNGALRRTPFYDGTVIHRVVNDPDFRIAQGGSPKGDGTDGPGYVFRDEFHPGLTHQPYILSMANSGPDSNGSQYFFTGGVGAPWLDGKHSVFGAVEDAASRLVVDAVLAAGSGATGILGIGFTRGDAAALAFDETAQGLPECEAAEGSLAVVRNSATTFRFVRPQAAGSIFMAFRSDNLSSWTLLGEVLQGTGSTGYDSIQYDNANAPRGFYRSLLVTYPDAITPASMAGRTLVARYGVADGAGGESVTCVFNGQGSGGLAVLSEVDVVERAFTTTSYSAHPYRPEWIIFVEGIGYLRIRGRLTGETATLYGGEDTVEFFTNSAWAPLGEGPLSLSK
jgi:peptidyl-prolyl cis-trans isomerase A (cyclophilin A)